jgi:hypothetical protein
MWGATTARASTTLEGDLPHVANTEALQLLPNHLLGPHIPYSTPGGDNFNCR